MLIFPECDVFHLKHQFCVPSYVKLSIVKLPFIKFLTHILSVENFLFFKTMQRFSQVYHRSRRKPRPKGLYLPHLRRTLRARALVFSIGNGSGTMRRNRRTRPNSCAAPRQMCNLPVLSTRSRCCNVDRANVRALRRVDAI